MRESKLIFEPRDRLFPKQSLRNAPAKSRETCVNEDRQRCPLLARVERMNLDTLALSWTRLARE